MEILEFEIETIGTLKYSRLKSLSILRKEINSYDYCYTMVKVKNLLDSILNNTFKEHFNLEFKRCFDIIFHDISYIVYNNYPVEENFPDNWIGPIG